MFAKPEWCRKEPRVLSPAWSPLSACVPESRETFPARHFQQDFPAVAISVQSSAIKINLHFYILEPCIGDHHPQDTISFLQCRVEIFSFIIQISEIVNSVLSIAINWPTLLSSWGWTFLQLSALLPVHSQKVKLKAVSSKWNSLNAMLSWNVLWTNESITFEFTSPNVLGHGHNTGTLFPKYNLGVLQNSYKDIPILC